MDGSCMESNVSYERYLKREFQRYTEDYADYILRLCRLSKV